MGKNNVESKFNEYVKSVADLFIREMEAGNTPWQKPWDGSFVMAQSAVTGRAYRGTNAMLLSLIQLSKHYRDPRWITYKQAQALGGQVRKGEHGIQCIFWKKIDPKEKTSDDSKSEDINKENAKDKFKLIPCPFTLFNVSQCDGLTLEPLIKPTHSWQPVEAAERILKASKATIYELEQNKAFYKPDEDYIVLPTREQFKSEKHFYDVALHELGHWTGHSSRLNRDLSNPFGSEKYAREELRAEIASFMMSATIGISHDVSQHAIYVKSWIQTLKEDPKELFRACTDAEQIKEYVFGLDKTLEISTPSVDVKEMPSTQKGGEMLTVARQFATLSPEERHEAATSIAHSLELKRLSKNINPYVQGELFGNYFPQKPSKIRQAER